MENRSGEVHVTTNEARGGSTPHVVRWILGISLLAAIVLLSLVWMTGAATHDGRESDNVESNIRSAAAERQARENTDSNVVEGFDDNRDAPNSTASAAAGN